MGRGRSLRWRIRSHQRGELARRCCSGQRCRHRCLELVVLSHSGRSCSRRTRSAGLRQLEGHHRSRAGCAGPVARHPPGAGFDARKQRNSSDRAPRRRRCGRTCRCSDDHGDRQNQYRLRVGAVVRPTGWTVVDGEHSGRCGCGQLGPCAPRRERRVLRVHTGGSRRDRLPRSVSRDDGAR